MHGGLSNNSISNTLVGMSTSHHHITTVLSRTRTVEQPDEGEDNTDCPTLAGRERMALGSVSINKQNAVNTVSTVNNIFDMTVLTGCFLSHFPPKSRNVIEASRSSECVLTGPKHLSARPRFLNTQPSLPKSCARGHYLFLRPSVPTIMHSGVSVLQSTKSCLRWARWGN